MLEQFFKDSVAQNAQIQSPEEKQNAEELPESENEYPDEHEPPMP